MDCATFSIRVYDAYASDMSAQPAEAAMDTGPVLEIEDLCVSILRAGGRTLAVDGVTLSVDEGEIVGLVGESGCGKTMTALSVLGLAPSTAAVTAARLRV